MNDLCPEYLSVACSYYVTQTFQSEFKLYSCLNVKELLAWNRRNIQSLNDSSKIWTDDYLARKWTLNH